MQDEKEGHRQPEIDVEQLAEMAQIHLSPEDAEELSRLLARTHLGIQKLRQIRLGDTEPPTLFQLK